MKRTILTLSFVIVAMVYSQAQQIAVVTGSGATSVHQTLADAINEADPGSTIYLPGGGFQISDDVKITKKLSIIGIGHKAVSENADGNTVISGNLFFNEGSSNSAIMGCYISGAINIGSEGASVNNILIKYCNIGGINVDNNTCTSTEINQNYIRGNSVFNGAGATFTNNVVCYIGGLVGGIISNNIVTYQGWCGSSCHYGIYCDGCTLSYNISLSSIFFYNGSNNNIYGNMAVGDNTALTLEQIDWNNVFVNYNNGAITPASDFHFKGEYQQYSDIGIYGGTGFSDGALPPVPYIVSKIIPEQTDASGKLNIKIRVKAGD